MIPFFPASPQIETESPFICLNMHLNIDVRRFDADICHTGYIKVLKLL